MKSLGGLIGLGFLLLLCGCAATQKLTVTTDPPGAQVTLVRYGTTETEGALPGMSFGSAEEPFEDAPISLGTSPLDYEFELHETLEQVSILGLFVDVKRKFTEGLVRAEKDGRAAERRVRFSGKPLVVDLLLPAE